MGIEFFYDLGVVVKNAPVRHHLDLLQQLAVLLLLLVFGVLSLSCSFSFLYKPRIIYLWMVDQLE